jgi:protein TonB
MHTNHRFNTRLAHQRLAGALVAALWFPIGTAPEAVLVTSVLASFAVGPNSRAESTVAPDERLPTLHCLSASGVQGNPRAECELVNDTSMSFLFDGSARTSPNYSVEQRRNLLWEPVALRKVSKPVKRHSVAAGAWIAFSANIPRAPEPVRLYLDVYRSGATHPITLSSNAIRLPGGIDGGQDEDVPMILCFEVSPPKVIHRVEPKYPEIARRARIQGTVVLEVVIAKDGTVSDARVVRSAPLLDDAAISALKEWKYAPARDRRGHPVPVYSRVSVKFEMPSPEPSPTKEPLNSGSLGEQH